MSGFFESVKARYFVKEELTEDLDYKALEQHILTNLWPSDYIWIGESPLNVYSQEVSLENIFTFFRSRMPWIHVQINNLAELQAKPADLLGVKYILYNQLAGLLAETHERFSEGFKREGMSLLRKINGPAVY